jgi:hypothetical protein
MRTALAALLCASVAFADPPASDAPLADPDAPGRALRLGAGEIAPYQGVLLDGQEDAHRERSRVRAETGEREWRTIAYASIGTGAAVTVVLVVLTGFAAAGKLK